MTNGDDEFKGYMKAHMENTSESLGKIEKSIEKSLLGYQKWNNRQDDAINVLEESVTEIKTNQKWFMRIFSAIQVAVVGLFSWLWSQRF